MRTQLLGDELQLGARQTVPRGLLQRSGAHNASIRQVERHARRVSVHVAQRQQRTTHQQCTVCVTWATRTRCSSARVKAA